MENKRIGHFLKSNHYLVFITVLLLSYAIVGVFEVLDEPPQSVHMIAQTDRASVALNYYEENLNFFKPRIHNVDNETGRVGLEFPFMNYLAALSYEVFGFHEILYRSLMLIVISAGIVAAYSLAVRFLKSPVLAGIITLLWASSPIIHFYGPNFLSGMASLGFVMGSWWCFFKQSSKLKWTILFFLLTALAGLAKISSGITIIAMILLVGLKLIVPGHVTAKLKAIPANKGTIISLAGSVIVIASWYLYSSYLKDFYESGYFLMKIKPITNWAEFKDVANTFIALWIDHIYATVIWVIIGACLIGLVVFIRKVNHALMAVTVLLFLGNAGFSFLMFSQLKYHDYYLLPLMVLPFFILLTTAKLVVGYVEAKSFSRAYRIAGMAVLGILLVPAFLHSEKIQDSRYNNGFKQFGVDYKPYVTIEPRLEKHGIDRSKHIISLRDRSPNITLYLMNRKGVTFNDDYNQSRIIYRIYKEGDYILANDTSFIDFPSIENFLDTPLFRYKSVGIYPVKLSKKDRRAFKETMLKTLQPMIDHYWAPKQYNEKIEKYTKYFGLSKKEARLKQAFGIYRWILNDIIAKKLKKRFPDKLKKASEPIHFARFFNKNRPAVKKLYKKGVLGKKEWLILKCNLPLLLYDYTP